MSTEILKANMDILACPECGGGQKLASQPQEHILICNTCSLVYPVIDDIPVLLNSSARNPKLEIPVLERFLSGAEADSTIWEACSKTIAILRSLPDAQSWEWEDETHWSAVYEKRMANKENTSRWNVRYWHRQPIVEAILESGSLHTRRILDIGCGEGQNFRLLFKNACKEDCLYIAIDISLSALRLNRSLNDRDARTPALYVLGSADSLPFREKSMDIVCLFGILHHSRLKEKNLPQVARLVREQGWIAIHEAVQRFNKTRRPASGESAHEERIKPACLKNKVYGLSSTFDIAYESSFFTLFYLLATRLLGSLMDTRRSVFLLVQSVDILLARIFGKIIPLFRPSEQRYLLRRRNLPNQ